MNIEEMARRTGYTVLQIERNEKILAQGAHFPNAVAAAKDDSVSTITYPDTGVFVLFIGSHSTSEDRKYAQCLDAAQRTIKEIVFQSRNAAAQFVLGATGKTDDWKE